MYLIPLYHIYFHPYEYNVIHNYCITFNLFLLRRQSFFRKYFQPLVHFPLSSDTPPELPLKGLASILFQAGNQAISPQNGGPLSFPIFRPQMVGFTCLKPRGNQFTADCVTLASEECSTLLGERPQQLKVFVWYHQRNAAYARHPLSWSSYW